MTFPQGNYTPENMIVPENDQDLRVFLKQVLESHARFLNRKDTGQYEEVEVQNNQTFPGATPQEKKIIYRKIFQFGAIAAGATLNIPHGINTIFQFTRFTGTIITNVVDDRPLPYVDEAVVTNQVSIKRLGINIVIINGATAPNITSGIAIVEFMKN